MNSFSAAKVILFRRAGNNRKEMRFLECPLEFHAHHIIDIYA